MSSTTEIANLALSHLGIGVDIQNLDSDTSPEAKACRRFFELSVQSTLRDWAWPFSRRQVALGLVEENPNDEWEYSYRYPSDCLAIRRVLSGSRQDTRDMRSPYLVGQDETARLIFSDVTDAVIEYTRYETDPTFYPPDFVMALSFKLAAYIAPRLTAGDPFKMRSEALKMYTYELTRAQANSANEEQPDVYPDSELIRIRE